VRLRALNLVDTCINAVLVRGWVVASSTARWLASLTRCVRRVPAFLSAATAALSTAFATTLAHKYLHSRVRTKMEQRLPCDLRCSKRNLLHKHSTTPITKPAAHQSAGVAIPYTTNRILWASHLAFTSLRIRNGKNRTENNTAIAAAT